MSRYVLKRLLLALPTVFIITVLAAFMLDLIPGDPASVIAGTSATVEDVRAIRVSLGLDQPFYKRYLSFVTGIVQADDIRSFMTRRPIAEEIRQRFPNTLKLALGGILLGVVIGIPLGVVSAVKQGTWVDFAISTVSLAGISVPVFWFGLMLIWFFAVDLRLLPIGGTSSWQSFVLPSVALAARPAATISRLLANSLLEVLSADYIRTARAKGLFERRVIYRHALRNALVAVVTVIGLQFGVMLGGTVVTETVFTINGLGRFLVQAISYRDYPVIQYGILFLAVVFLLVNLAVDVIYGFLDPRIKYD